MKNLSISNMAKGAMVASIYTLLCLAFSPFSYGLIQVRIAEALTLLAVFTPTMGVGVILGCGVANFVGLLLGTNPLLFDVVIGTAATGVAVYLSYKLRGVRFKGYPILSVWPPILINGLFIGAELTYLETNTIFSNPKILAINGLYVMLGQLIPCLILGPLLVGGLEKTGVANKYLLPHKA